MPNTKTNGNVGDINYADNRRERICSFVPVVNGIQKMQAPSKLYFRVFVTLLFWGCGVFLNNMSATVAGRRFLKGANVLPDIGFMHIPYISWRFLPDLYYIIFAGYSILRLLVMKQNGIILFMRIFLIMGAELMLRALVVNSTLLPDPYPPCAHYKPHFTTYAPFELQCGDVLFSGHTAAWSIISFMWVMHSENMFDKATGVLGTVLGGLILIATRYHYTVDVLVGAYVGVTMCFIYYSCARLMFGGDVRKSFRLFKFFEEPCLLSTYTKIELNEV
jgi:hypothetical protein